MSPGVRWACAVAAALAVAGAVLISLSRPGSSPAALAPAPGPVSVGSVTAARARRPTPGTAPVDSTSGAVLERQPKVSEFAPAPEELRAEVERNPHQTPLSLVRFAVKLGRRMDDAMRSSEQARRLFGELADCAMDPKLAGSPSTQAICLSNAQRLSSRFEELRPSLQALIERTDPGVVELAR